MAGGPMAREIVLDTETTGLDPKNGDRLIEIGCVELINRMPTGQEFHVLINPERDVPLEAQAVHGISTAQLKDKPLFAAIAADFLAFIGSDTLVIHNANFDIGFLNAELVRVRRPVISMVRVVDTLAMARRKHPAGPNTLDALCKRYGIDMSRRVKHGAIIDSLLLADVYLELLGERQAGLALASSGSKPANGERSHVVWAAASRVRSRPLPLRITPAELEAHSAFIALLAEKAAWRNFS